jgi:sugar lactone lactonase YvrE
MKRLSAPAATTKPASSPFTPTTSAKAAGRGAVGGPGSNHTGDASLTAPKGPLARALPFASHNAPAGLVATAGALAAITVASIAQGQTLPSVPGFTVDVYASTPTPARLALRSDGTLFAGNNPASNGNAPLAQFACGGTPVLRTADVFDPDVMAIDETGLLTGLAGSAITAGGRTTMTFWSPQNTTRTFTFVGRDPDDITPDANGNLLIAANGVFRFNGTTVTRLFTTPLDVLSIAVDTDGAILASLTDGRVQVYSAQGQLLVTNLTMFTSPAQIRKDTSGVFGGGFVALDGGLWRLSRQGARTQIGSGFTYFPFTSGLAIDTNGVLFISETANNRILRVGQGPHVCGPTNSNACATGSASVSVSAVGTGPFTYAWQVQDATAPTSWRTLVDGTDPVARTVTGSNTQTLTIARGTPGANLVFRALVSNATGTTTSKRATIAIDQCDCIDYNNDGIFPSDDDLMEFLNVMAGGGCSTGELIESEFDAGCNDLDFNNDGIFPSDEDLLAFLRILGGGSCL